MALMAGMKIQFGYITIVYMLIIPIMELAIFGLLLLTLIIC